MDIISVTSSAVVGVGLGYGLRLWWGERQVKTAEARAKAIVQAADEHVARTRRELDVEVRERYLKLRHDFEEETKERRERLEQQEERARQREENLERKVDLLEAKDRDLLEREHRLTAQQEEGTRRAQELARLHAEAREQMLRISRLSPEDARRSYLVHLEQELKDEIAARLKRVEETAREQAEALGRSLLMEAIQRCASEQTATATVTVVRLSSDEMKGRIIGRDGRNIRAFQMLTGVDVVIDETPEAVVLSGFDPYRRELARITLERLLVDGRISPARIEEVVDEVKQDLERTVVKEGEGAATALGVFNLHPELIKCVGRLRFHLTYGQTVLAHAKETAHLLGLMVSELSLDPAVAKRIGLLHDIGKAAPEDTEGTHAQIGAMLARQFGESELVANAIEAHHQEVEPQSEYAVLGHICCAISGQRPGARRESLDAYIKRLEKLEQIADSFRGVDRAYAMQAGRELRVLVRPEAITDVDMLLLARDIAKRVQEEIQYPGQIKVTIIRETKAVEYTKA